MAKLACNHNELAAVMAFVSDQIRHEMDNFGLHVHPGRHRWKLAVVVEACVEDFQKCFAAAFERHDELLLRDSP